jgi:hypothetical protein
VIFYSVEMFSVTLCERDNLRMQWARITTVWTWYKECFSWRPRKNSNMPHLDSPNFQGHRANLVFSLTFLVTFFHAAGAHGPLGSIFLMLACF